MARRHITQAVKFLRRDMWRIRARHLSRRKSIPLRLLRVVVLALKGFSEDRGYLQASALTFYSLLSLVPVVAMAFGVAKGFGMEEKLEVYVRNALEGHGEVAARIIDFSRTMLENTRGGLIAGIGVLVLLYSVMRMLSRIEASINGIWGIRKSRPTIRRVADYISVLVVGPVLLIMGSSITVMATVRIHSTIESMPVIGGVAPLILLFFRSLPWLLMIFMFTFLYVFMPNTKVKVGSALAGGVVAGTLYNLVQWGYINFQVGIAQYNAIYGSFAALPLFLLWLQISWVVALLGAEVSFAWQNVETYEFESDCLEASRRFKKITALRVAHLVVRRFMDEKPPPTHRDVSHDLEIPIRLANEALDDLTAASVVAEIVPESGRDPGFRPARPPERITVHYVLGALDLKGKDQIPLNDSESSIKLIQCIDSIDLAIEGSAANILLKDLPTDLPAPRDGSVRTPA